MDDRADGQAGDDIDAGATPAGATLGSHFVIGRIHCERLVASERNGTSGTRVQIDLPLSAGDYSAEVFETRGDAIGLRLRLA